MKWSILPIAPGGVTELAEIFPTRSNVDLTVFNIDYWGTRSPDHLPRPARTFAKACGSVLRLDDGIIANFETSVMPYVQLNTAG